MDFQHVADSIGAMTCIVSVEKLEGGRHGAIRIVTGNRAYIDSIEHPAPGMQMLTTEFVPNSKYTRYFTRDLNFEDYCYRAAVEKKCLHSYAHPDRMDAWFNMTFMPLWPDDGNICYCTYTMEINFEPSSERLSNVSGELASAVLETSLKLSGSKDFKATMGDVIKDIRKLCDAEYCCILLVDTHERTCSVLCDDRAEGSILRPDRERMDSGFYDIAASWEDTIAGSNCLVVKSAQDMDVVKERNPQWHQSLQDGAVETIVMFPLKTGNELLGYMWAVNFDPKNAGKIKETLELTTFVLGLEIGTHLLVDQLQFLSSRDMLTGILNRNEMNARVNRLSNGALGSGKSVGVVFADLNGLKAVNDIVGHAAGDALLKDAALTLREVFDDDELFRAGGDEFIAIMVGATEDDVERKIAALRAASATSERHGAVSFAIGGCVEDDCRNITRAMLLSDERMYEDKDAYYAQHPKPTRK